MNYVTLSSYLEDNSSFNNNIWGDISSGNLHPNSLCIYERYYYHGTDVDYVKETCYVSLLKDEVLYVNPVAGISYNGQGHLLKAQYKKFGYSFINKDGLWKQVMMGESDKTEVIPSEDTICERLYPINAELPPERVYVQSGKVIEGGNSLKPGDNFDTENLPEWCLAQLEHDK